MSWARGKRAYGFCDRCSFRYNLDRLSEEIENGAPNGLLVCPVCLDEDHPQNSLGDHVSTENTALRNPRPDTAQGESRRLFSWSPVGSNLPAITLYLGVVTVVVS